MKIHRMMLPSLLIATLTFGACAGPADSDGEADGTPTSSTPTASSTPTSSADGTTEPTQAATETPTSEEPTGPTLAVTISGSDVGPNAEEISVGPGDPITITFDTDRAGELHVHSKPEQYVEFKAGTSRQTLIIDTPGSVEIEEHDSEAVVAVVQVK